MNEIGIERERAKERAMAFGLPTRKSLVNLSGYFILSFKVSTFFDCIRNSAHKTQYAYEISNLVEKLRFTKSSLDYCVISNLQGVILRAIFKRYTASGRQGEWLSHEYTIARYIGNDDLMQYSQLLLFLGAALIIHFSFEQVANLLCSGFRHRKLFRLGFTFNIVQNQPEPNRLSYFRNWFVAFLLDMGTICK